MIGKAFLLLGLGVGAFLIYVALQPSEFVVARELVIKAPPEVIFPYINNSKKSMEWMPWKDSDPGAQMVYSGPEEGVGATTTWDSPGKMGTGQALVTESIPNQSVKTQLTYTKPMTMSQLAEVSLTPTGDGTLVKWSVTGNNSFVGRIFCVFLNMDKMVGSEFEKGLAALSRKVAGN